ncbi:TolC family protein [Zoogloea sp.]|uniref:TolC family protein n=2 Tax=Zoogloea sp. TaxID=49181 RepID=UPI0035B29BD5
MTSLLRPISVPLGLLISVLGCILPAWSGELLEMPLSEAQTRLLNANPNILRARATWEAAQAGLQTAGARPNPTLGVSVSSIKPGQRGSYWDRPLDQILSLNQTLERGDKRALRLQAAEHGLQASQAELDNTIRLMRGELAGTWVQLKAAQEIHQTALENAALAERTAQAAAVRLKAGDLSGVDAARFAADAARVRNDARLAERDLTRAQLALALLLGYPADGPALVAKGDWPTAPAPSRPAEGQERPDLAAARLRLAQADQQRNLARAQRTRDITVGVQYEHQPPDGRNTYGFSLSIPLFVGNDFRGDIARSEADYTTASIQLEDIRARARSEQQALSSELAAHQATFNTLRDQVLPAAERAAKGAEVAILKGGMGLTDYLDTQRTLRITRIELIQARAALASTALLLNLAEDTQK